MFYFVSWAMAICCKMAIFDMRHLGPSVCITKGIEHLHDLLGQWIQHCKDSNIHGDGMILVFHHKSFRESFGTVLHESTKPVVATPNILETKILETT